MKSLDEYRHLLAELHECIVLWFVSNDSFRIGDRPKAVVVTGYAICAPPTHRARVRMIAVRMQLEWV